MARAVIRPKVVCLLVHGSRTLWIRARDGVMEEDFLVPPGGGVEFGERLLDAVRREVREELRIELEQLHYLDFSENLFQFNGREEHELVFFFAARAPVGLLTQSASLEVVESSGERLTARWYTPEELADGRHVVYPAGILAHLPRAISLAAR